MVYPDSSKGRKVVDLGEAAAFTEFPATVVIDDFEFYLAQGRDGAYSLLSSLCPHSWGAIYREDNCFVCPSHGWRFDLSDGVCINGPNARMYTFEVTTRDGHLFVAVPGKSA
jgi:nitrite reductase/ring-hydroxylating ferredoxin subunit